MWPDVFVFSLSVEDSGIPGQYNGLIMCGLTFLFFRCLLKTQEFRDNIMD